MHTAIEHNEALLWCELIEGRDHLSPRFTRRQHRQWIVFFRHCHWLLWFRDHGDERWPRALAAVILANLIACDTEQPGGKAKLVFRAHCPDTFKHGHKGVRREVLG
jgi:hypothetical protein